MSDQPTSIILEHLRAIRAEIAAVKDDTREIKMRLTNVEATQGTILQHIGHLSSTIAQQQLSFDRLTARVERIENRLELAV